ncbi:MAG: sulfite exporter TauE/SafE family protein [Archangium sp.]|nr:sulfite exporter TauE/SafE family protein [Archangium sp.]MDP3154256.1 sulfite exporter TauE/SafE family protein [Archangium sp.]MDP3575944.1 sulfite exporter TauE/SafE family protein [Archangium sp.]
MLSTAQLIGAAAAGVVGGLLSGFFGVGGNFILVPLLGLALGLNQHQAQGLTLAALLPPLGAPAVWQYRRAGVPLLWPVVGLAILGFLPAIPIGSLVANELSAPVLRSIFAVLLGVTALRTWRATKGQSVQPHLTEPPRGYIPTALLSGVAAGFASGLLGIGGAIVLIPLLTRRLGMSQKQAQLTSLAMLLPPIALPGVWVYAQESGIPWGSLVPVACGFVVGAFFGAKLNQVVSPARLTRGFAVLLLISAVVLVLTALR